LVCVGGTAHVALFILAAIYDLWLPCSLHDGKTAVNCVTNNKMADQHSGRFMLTPCILLHLRIYICTQHTFLYLKQNPKINHNLRISTHAHIIQARFKQ